MHDRRMGWRVLFADNAFSDRKRIRQKAIDKPDKPPVEGARTYWPARALAHWPPPRAFVWP